MPSLRGRLGRRMMKLAMGRVFVGSRSIPIWRNRMDRIAGYQSVPAGTEILPVRINGMAAEWVRAPQARTDRAVLYLHGGAFVVGSPATHRELAARLSAVAGARVLVLDYRLAPEFPFPAALEDAVSAFQGLLAQGYPHNHLVIGGDSAGGGLALKTLIALRDAGISLPAAAIFISPVTEWLRLDGESYVTRAASDPINTLETCRFTASLYVGNNDPENPLLDPLGMDLSGLPPICIHVGDDEVLLSDSLRLAERVRACSGQVELKVWPGMWHVFQMAARLVPEARQSIAEIGQFIASRFHG